MRTNGFDGTSRDTRTPSPVMQNVMSAPATPKASAHPISSQVTLENRGSSSGTRE